MEKVDAGDFSWFPDQEALGVHKKQESGGKNLQSEVIENLTAFITRCREWQAKMAQAFGAEEK